VAHSLHPLEAARQAIDVAAGVLTGDPVAGVETFACLVEGELGVEPSGKRQRLTVARSSTSNSTLSPARHRVNSTSHGAPDTRHWQGRRELQSSPSCHGEAGDFRDDRTELAMPQSLLETNQHRLLVSPRHGTKAGQSECRREQILASDAPQHATSRTCCSPFLDLEPHKTRKCIYWTFCRLRHLAISPTSQ
jgi:hypothetical protein